MKLVNKCPRCGNRKSWLIRRGKRRCSQCRYEWCARKQPLNLSTTEWRWLLKWFFLGQSSARIAEEAKLDRKKVLKALTLVRQVMAHDLPPVFEGIVEIDETYLGGSWRNKRKNVRAKGAKRGRGTMKQAVFGILCRNGQVWAEIVTNVEADTLLPLLKQRVIPGTVVCSDTFKSYTGVAAKGYVHRLVRHERQEYSDTRGNHINGLEGFWGYLKRMLAAKGGIRNERLPLYLAEYVWRYNHRKLKIRDKIKCVLSLIQHKYEFSG